MLYESDLRSIASADVLAERILAADPPVNPYTIELVDGVRFNSERIDEILAGLFRGLDPRPDAAAGPRHPAAGNL